MKVITRGTTRDITIINNVVIKECKEDYQYENKREYDNFEKYKDAPMKIVNNILLFSENIIYAEKCKTIDEVININSDYNYMDKIFLNSYLDKKYNYSKKRKYLLENTNLSFDEFQIPENWGINKDNELVLIDYSR